MLGKKFTTLHCKTFLLTLGDHSPDVSTELSVLCSELENLSSSEMHSLPISEMESLPISEMESLPISELESLSSSEL
jgi:hypothetical protein